MTAPPLNREARTGCLVLLGCLALVGLACILVGGIALVQWARS